MWATNIRYNRPCVLKRVRHVEWAQREVEFLKKLSRSRGGEGGSETRIYVPVVFGLHVLLDGSAVIEMQDVGPVLDSMLNGLKFNAKLSCNLAIDLLSAVSFIHRRGIAHLDIKPSNVTVSNG